LSTIAFIQEILEFLPVYDYRRAPAPHGTILQQARQAVAHGLPRGTDHLGQVVLGEAQVDDRAPFPFRAEITGQPEQQIREPAGSVESSDFRLPLLRLPEAC